MMSMEETVCNLVKKNLKLFHYVNYNDFGGFGKSDPEEFPIPVLINTICCGMVGLGSGKWQN